LREDWGAVGGDRPLTERPISASKVARQFLGRSPAWFSAHRVELEAKGFPRPIQVSGRYRPDQVQAWLDGKPIVTPNPELTLEGLAGQWEKSA
jgi:hypothetical protein